MANLKISFVKRFHPLNLGFRRRDLAFGMGNGEGAVLESRHGAAAGREPGERRWRAGVDVHKCLLGDVSGLHEPARGAGAAARQIRRLGR